jgi:hypothetical protein
MRDSKGHAAKRAFEKRNPFDDPKAHNCVIEFEDAARCDQLGDEPEDACKLEANLVHNELNKIVKAAGKTVSHLVPSIHGLGSTTDVQTRLTLCRLSGLSF